ncbi:MAG: DUF1467 family protein [Deinococcus-Thermus bacterium]|jgi:predicted secreted protein|nr:DUF1467 family protein [Deinococcota bacterium]
MQITSAIVLFAVIWFLVLFVVLPLNLRTQGEAGEIVPGTPGSAPTDPRLRRKAKIVTAVTVPLWAVACTVIVTGTITIDDFNLFERFGPSDATPDRY